MIVLNHKKQLLIAFYLFNNIKEIIILQKNIMKRKQILLI